MVQKHKPKKIKQLSAKQFIKKFSDDSSRDDISNFSYEGFTIDFDVESYDPWKQLKLVILFWF